MNVCYVTHLPNLTGANRSMLDMLEGIDSSIYKPLVLLNSHGPIEDELKKRNINYRITFYSPATNSDNFIKNMCKRILNSYILNKFSVYLIKRILKKEKIDLVHNNTYIVGAGMEAALELNIPYICHIREFVWEDHHRKFFNEKKQKLLLNNATEVIAITESIKEKFQNETSKKIHVLVDGIKTEDYLLPYKKILNKNEINILLAGRITPGKGQYEAIKAIEILNKLYTNIILHIVGGIGDENYNTIIHNYVEDNHLKNVKFYNFINDLKELRSRCDIGLTCSKAEALGRVTIENMLSSMLVIGNKSAGTKELITNMKNGLLYISESYEDLAKTIQFAIENTDLSNRLVEVGYTESKNKFDHLVYGKTIMYIYSNIK